MSTPTIDPAVTLDMRMSQVSDVIYDALDLGISVVIPSCDADNLAAWLGYPTTDDLAGHFDCDANEIESHPSPDFGFFPRCSPILSPIRGDS